MNCYSHHFHNPDFWNFTLNDISTALIAIINVGLVIYIFVYQRKKDSSDHKFILSHIDFNLKSEWFKSVILEPNIEAFHSFFVNIYNQFSKAESSLTEDKKVILIDFVNSNCNNLEFRFISILGCVDQNLENHCIDIIDNLRDSLSNKVLAADKLNIDEFQSHITISKREIISRLYNFIPKDLN